MDDKKRTARYWMAFLILAVFLMILFVWNVNAGSIHLSVSEILNIIFRHQGDATAYNIIWEIRLPRILSVIILGGEIHVHPRIRQLLKFSRLMIDNQHWQ